MSARASGWRDPAEKVIGIAVPTLNSGRTLDWTLLALTRQSGITPRILVADSGSTDDTLAICERWWVPHIFVPCGNMYAAINAALRQLDAPWLTYLNSDDIVYPEGYARLIETAERAGADVVYGRCDFVDSEGRHLYGHIPARPSIWPALLRLGIMPFSQPAGAFRREVFEAMGGFNEDERTASDFDFFLRAHKAGRRVIRTPGPSVAAFRMHDAQLSFVERDQVTAERGRFLAAAGISAHRMDRVSHWIWRLENTGELLQRLLRTGHLQRRRQ